MTLSLPQLKHLRLTIVMNYYPTHFASLEPVKGFTKSRLATPEYALACLDKPPDLNKLYSPITSFYSKHRQRRLRQLLLAIYSQPSCLCKPTFYNQRFRIPQNHSNTTAELILVLHTSTTYTMYGPDCYPPTDPIGMFPQRPGE
jgi:hypothetical protein